MASGADYGTVPAGEAVSCQDIGLCYQSERDLSPQKVRLLSLLVEEHSYQSAAVAEALRAGLV